MKCMINFVPLVSVTTISEIYLVEYKFQNCGYETNNYFLFNANTTCIICFILI